MDLGFKRLLGQSNFGPTKMSRSYYPWLTCLPSSIRLWEESKCDFMKKLFADTGNFKDWEVSMHFSL